MFWHQINFLNNLFLYLNDFFFDSYLIILYSPKVNETKIIMMPDIPFNALGMAFIWITVGDVHPTLSQALQSASFTPWNRRELRKSNWD